MIHAFNVTDSYEIEGRGLLILVDKDWNEMSKSGLILSSDDEIEIRPANGLKFQTNIVSIELLPVPSPRMPVGIVLPISVQKYQVPQGAEVWITKSDAREPMG